MPTGSHPLAGQERLWEPLLPALRERLPLLTFGPYEPNQRAGPASWLRCMIALTLPDDVLPAHAVPVIYLGGVRRADIRAIEDCPKTVQRLAGLQYRGVLWTHKNGGDCTVAGFLQSADGGLGIAVSGDAATKEALGRALLRLAYEPVARLQREAPLKATFFDELLHPDQVRSSCELARKAKRVKRLRQLKVSWEPAPDNVDHPTISGPGSHHKGGSTHLHAEFTVEQVLIYIDRLWGRGFGPGRCFTEFRIFVDGELAGRGGVAGASIGAGNSDAPALALIGADKIMCVDTDMIVTLWEAQT